MNYQHPSKPINSDGRSILVNEIFHSIQGEGPFSGQKALFIRLARCNLQCPQCDTEYSRFREMTVAAIIEEMMAQDNSGTNRLPLVVITGGEPLLQNLVPLVNALRDNGATVQIETNGTRDLPPELCDKVHVVCSPKTSVVKQSLRGALSFWLKYVCGAENITNDLRIRSVLGYEHPVFHPSSEDIERKLVFVMPLDEGDEDKNRANRKAAVNVAMRSGFTLQCQLHKLMGAK